MKRNIVIFFLIVFSFGIVTSCRTQSNAQRATKTARKRWKHIKHDCNCHAYMYPIQEDEEDI